MSYTFKGNKYLALLKYHLRKQYPKNTIITSEDNNGVEKSWELRFYLTMPNPSDIKSFSTVLNIRSLRRTLTLEFVKKNDDKYFQLKQLPDRVLDTIAVNKMRKNTMFIRITKNDGFQITIDTIDNQFKSKLIKNYSTDSTIETIDPLVKDHYLTVENLVFYSGSIDDLVIDDKEGKTGEKVKKSNSEDEENEEDEENSGEKEDLKKSLHGVKTFNTRKKDNDGVLEKSWQLYFDLVVPQLVSGVVLKIKSLTNPKILDLILHVNNNDTKSLNLVQSITDSKGFQYFNILSKFDMDGNLWEKAMKVKIFKSDGIQLIVNDHKSALINSESLPEYALRNALIDFQEKNEGITVKNVMFINGESALRTFKTAKLFTTFRILVDLRITKKSSGLHLLFNIKNKKQTLIEVSYQQDKIRYCYFLAEETDKCKDLEVEKDKWVHLLIEQWKASDTFYNTIKVNSGIQQYITERTRDRSITNNFNIQDPKINDVLVTYNVLNADIKSFVIFNPASDTFGVIRFNGKQVYQNHWTKENSKVVCTMLKYNFMHEITIDKDVQFYNGFEYNNKTFSCIGDEQSLNDCRQENYLSGIKQPAAVACTNWSDDLLNESLDTILLTGTNMNIISSLNYYLTDLKQRFGKWSCSSVNPDNQNICSVDDVISEAFSNLQNLENENAKKAIKLSDKYNLQKLLEFEFLKKSFDYLKNELYKTKTSIGKYFRNLADFDNQLANHDLTYARDMWDKANNIIKEKEDDLLNSILELQDSAIAMKAGDLLHQIGKLLIQILGRLNPIKWITDTDEGIIGPLETSIEIAKNMKDLATIVIVYSENIEKLNAILKKSNGKRSENKETFTKINDILNKAKSNIKLTLADCKTFLELYGGYTPAIEQSDIDEYSGIVEAMVDTFIEKISDPQSLLGTVASGFGEYKANNIKMALKLLFGQYEVVKEKQSEIMDAFARSARSMLAKKSAEDIINDSGDTDLQKKLKMIKGVYLTRSQKLRLYTDLCHIYTYRNHGMQTSDCTQILMDPDTSDFRLLSYNLMPDMCSNAETISKIVLIPLNLEGDIKKGILSSNELFRYYPSADPKKNEWVTNGTTSFKIPNKQWLVNHGWISNEIKEPIFLKKLELFLPLETKDVTFSYEVEMQLQTVTLRNVKYSFESKIKNKISYNSEDCLKPENNPYKMTDCRKLLTNLCILTSGQVDGGFLPVLEDSKFSISLRSRTKLTKLYPIDIIYLKANVEFCSKKQVQTKSEISNPVILNEDTESCCTDTNKYFDLFEQINFHQRIRSRQAFCKVCPENSTPKFFGYFCQKCPQGFKETNEWFGCEQNTDTTLTKSPKGKKIRNHQKKGNPKTSKNKTSKK
ncbi:uncharacterized protein LOC100201811 isoform X5 [Hydra vulgaris]|uniref:Uncharacterized protein LOC100201811 isoform X5 n=1 Tax=Hydra vulgaris TaxID=6087 RepID=A0ABM4DNY1_HYDVU